MGENLNLTSNDAAAQTIATQHFTMHNKDGDEIPVTVYGEGDLKAVEQLMNCLREGSAAGGALMADHHVGYSQPIGGVVAYEHHISPSGVGYDISCLVGGTPVLSRRGYSVSIEEVTASTRAACWDGSEVREISPLIGAVSRGVREVISVRLANGKKLTLTPDHLVRVREGWQRADSLEAGEKVAVAAFQGLPYEAASEKSLDLRLRDSKKKTSLQAELTERGLFPLRPSDERFPALLRLLAYCVGDGHLNLDNKTVSFYTSDAKDAQTVLSELLQVGFEARSYQRVRPNGSLECHVKVGSRALHALFEAMGCPKGKKVITWDDHSMDWLLTLPAWQRAQFLSSLISAEGTTPKWHQTGITQFAIKQSGVSDAGIRFIERVFNSLGFSGNVMPSGEAVNGVQSWVFVLHGGGTEITRLYREVGYCYSHKKRSAAAQVISVSEQRESRVSERERAHAASLAAQAAGVSNTQIVSHVAEAFSVSESFVHHALHGRGLPRRGKGDYAPDTDGEVIFSQVVEVSNIGEKREVFDVVTGDPALCFIADGVVVHNCGIKGVRTNLLASDVDDWSSIMDEVVKNVSFGMGRKNSEKVDHPVLDEIRNASFEPQRKMAQLAADQLGTVGSGNHFVELCEDASDGSLWIITHFGSRGFGHKTANGFLALAQGREFSDKAPEGEMASPPVLLDTRTDLGQAYIEAMQLAGRYAYAGRDVVCERVMGVLGASSTREVHEHHNFAWKENIGGRDLWVVRKGATPAYPGQEGVVGGSMEYGAVVLEGQDDPESELSFYSTVHGAGRVMSRTQAAGKVKRRKVYECSHRDCDFDIPARDYKPNKSECPRHGKKFTKRVHAERVREGRVDWDVVRERLRGKGIELRGGAADEAPEVYKNLDEVLDHHGNQIRVQNRLKPRGVAMAGPDTIDRYKD